ncbi:hypothetical protein T492DRAFT_907378 [Pavlovales sp. CCMP2436]|nr:hypothetical protein T492DRAFT_907378 [Pavlovales sp. CCMP2436]
MLAALEEWLEAASAAGQAWPGSMRVCLAGLVARLVAAAESTLPPLLRALTGDPLCAVLSFLHDADVTSLRLVCRAFRDHSSPALKKCRVDFLRTRARGVRFVDNRQCALAADVCVAAAGKGQVDALAWLHSRGCSICFWAAQGGHLEVLRYAHEHGCPMQWEECIAAALVGGYAEMVAYLRAAQPAA